MQLEFRELFLFSPCEKLARRIEFTSGINVITSRQEDGTNRGKSVVLRCLYYALGAETWIETKFDIRNKVVILHFDIDGIRYYILRADRLVKLFDGANKRLLFSVTSAQELAKQLSKITHFSVRLPNRKNNALEMTPPAYNYLPYFLDQDHYQGSKFESFDKLSQFANFKKGVLDYHFGVASEETYRLVERKQRILKDVAALEERQKLLNVMLSVVMRKLKGSVCPGQESALRADMERYRKQYSKVAEEISEIRSALLKLRNVLSEFKEIEINLFDFGQENETAITKLNQHRCPECNTELPDTVMLRGKRYNLSENIDLLKRDVQIEIAKIEDDIASKEGKFDELSKLMEELDKQLSFDSSAIKDIIQFRGLSAIYDEGVRDCQIVHGQCSDARKEIAEIEKNLSMNNDDRRKINEEYYTLLMQAKDRFGLNEISSDKFKSLDLTFNASGSDRCIATVIWYVAIIKLRNRFNPQAIRFPIVFDSPNNVENDDVKTKSLISYLLENSKLSGQFVMSGIGFDTATFKQTTEEPMNIVVLRNEQFKLLLREDYERYSGLMHELLDGTEKS